MEQKGLTPYQQRVLYNMRSNPQASYIPVDTDSSAVRRILTDANGRLRCLPAAELTALDRAELRLFCQEEAVYQLPTVELIAQLRDRIGDRTALEIGAGRGDIGRHLGIRLTDSHMQAEPQYRKLYEAAGAHAIRYPKDIEKLNYKQAIKKYKPAVVVACWVSHQFSEKRPEMAGSIAGLDTQWIVDHCKEFLFVGHPVTHQWWTIPQCRHETLDGYGTIVSRAGCDGHILSMKRK
jgi:hypothetical protein